MSACDRKVRPEEFLTSGEHLCLQCAVGSPISFRKSKGQPSADNVLNSKKRPLFFEKPLWTSQWHDISSPVWI